MKSRERVYIFTRVHSHNTLQLCESAIDDKGLSGDKTTEWPGEEFHDPRNVFESADPIQGAVGDKLFLVRP